MFTIGYVPKFTLQHRPMLTLPESVEIYSVANAEGVQAELQELTRELAGKLDGTWWSIPVSKAVREKEGDHHWKWRKLVGEIRQKAAWDSLGIVCEDTVQGAMLFRVDAKSSLEPGEGAVYVDRLSTAPTNRPWLCDPPNYRGIGTVLMLAAVRSSYSLGLKGRVRLESLPSEKTREFYDNRGFTVIKQDTDGMIDYELPAASADQWLRDEGYLK